MATLTDRTAGLYVGQFWVGIILVVSLGCCCKPFKNLEIEQCYVDYLGCLIFFVDVFGFEVLS